MASTYFGLMTDGSRGDRFLIRTLVYILILGWLIGMFDNGITRFDKAIGQQLVSSFTVEIMWMVLGAALALFVQLLAEGHGHNLWVKFHPQSAPTPEAKMGQRCYVTDQNRRVMPATLVGSATQFLSSDLDLREETLIRLCYFAFEDRGPLMFSRLESSLRVGTGRRQRAFHKIAAGMRGRPNLKRTLHRYWRSVNGSSRMGQALFTDLCRLARETHNRDKATIDRLTIVGAALGLAPEDMGRAIRSSL